MKSILLSFVLLAVITANRANAAIAYEHFTCEAMHHEGQGPVPIPDFPNYAAECYIRMGGVVGEVADAADKHSGISCVVVTTSSFPVGHVSKTTVEVVSEKKSTVVFKGHNLLVKYHKRTTRDASRVEIEIPSLKLEANCAHDPIK